MKKFLILMCCIASNFANAQFVFLADTGDVTFYSYAPVEDIRATCNVVNSVFNSQTGEIAFAIPMRSFKFQKSLMQEHFNEKYMESDKYPQATYKGKVNGVVDTGKPGKYSVTTTGSITIHGKEKVIDESGEVEVTDSAHMIISSRFFVALEDFNIKKPQILFNNIADTIEVKIKAYYKPYQKKSVR